MQSDIKEEWSEECGYLKEIFVNQKEINKHLCRICNRVYRDPVEVHCKTTNNSYKCCTKCFNQREKSEPCPFYNLEKNSTSEKHKLESHELSNQKTEVLKLRANCPFKKKHTEEDEESTSENSDSEEEQCSYKNHRLSHILRHMNQKHMSEMTQVFKRDTQRIIDRQIEEIANLKRRNAELESQVSQQDSEIKSYPHVDGASLPSISKQTKRKDVESMKSSNTVDKRTKKRSTTPSKSTSPSEDDDDDESTSSSSRGTRKNGQQKSQQEANKTSRGAGKNKKIDNKKLPNKNETSNTKRKRKKSFDTDDSQQSSSSTGDQQTENDDDDDDDDGKPLADSSDIEDEESDTNQEDEKENSNQKPVHSKDLPKLPYYDFKREDLEVVQIETDSDVDDDKEKEESSYTWEVPNPLYDTYHGYSYQSKALIQKHADGFCYGAAIGDSIGSYFIASQGVSDSSRLAEALKMKGGGMRYGDSIKSGQGTDDTEMAICIARGLSRMILQNLEKNTPHRVTMEFIAEEYRTWWDSEPLDTASKMMSSAVATANVTEMRQKAYEQNQHIIKEFNENKGVLTNGSLIRCMPLVIYGIRLRPEQTFNLMRLESSLTHASYTVYYAITVYALAAQYLIRNPMKEDRNRKAVEYAQSYLFEKKTEYKKVPLQWKVHSPAIEEVDKWINKAKAVADASSSSSHDHSNKASNRSHTSTGKYGHAKLDDFREFSSHIKISFQRAFCNLYKGSKYDDAIKETLGVGGNTDSNCCVVGGLMGAYHGIDELDKWKKKIDGWNQEDESIRRKREPYQAKNYATYIPFLLLYALHPKKLSLGDSATSCDGTKKEEFIL